MITASEQARHYLSKCGPAISGNHGHNQAFSVACILLQGFNLSIEEARPLLLEWNQTCQPPFSAAECEHKLKDAERAAPPPEGRGHMLSKRRVKHTFGGHAAPEPLKPLPPVAPPKPKAQGTKYEITETPLPEPMSDATRQLLKAAFLPGEGVRIGPGRIDDSGKEVASRDIISLPLEEWLKKLDKYDGNMNRIFTCGDGQGIFVGCNPLKPGGSRDADVTAFRHALIEWDNISEAGQWSIIQQSNVPATAVIRSGGKSVHAWVKVDAKDRQEYDERVRMLHEHFEFSGCKIDPNNKNPSRLSRLAGVKRKDKRQELLALNIGAESFTHWIKERQVDDVGPGTTLVELLAMDTRHDPNCVLGFRNGESLRYLCKGKAAWLIGPSGIGKSTLTTEFAVGWALGLPVFGITPSRPLKSVIIQAENDDYDLAEMAQGIARAHDLNPDFDPENRLAGVNANLVFHTEDTCRGQTFLDRLVRIIDRHKPDLLWVDPLLSFAGIDVSKQDQVSEFLREGIQPILRATGAVMIGLHHTGKWKTSQKEMATWTALDFAYAGLGSSELVNWARAVMTLVPLEGDTYRLEFAKRGSRAGATHPDGTDARHTVYARHGKGCIRWEQIPPPEPQATPRKGKEAKLPKPQQIASLNLHDFLKDCKAEGEGVREVNRRLEEWLAANGPGDLKAASEGTCRAAVTLLIASGKLKKTGAGNDVKIMRGPNA